MSQAVLLADIDNTLYDWPSFFAPSFRAMIHALSRELDVSEDQLYDESKAIFSRHKSLEYAFVIQELDSVRSENSERIGHLIEQGRGAFKRVQRKRLTPYPGVIKTLKWLRKQDVLVVAVTNSPVYRAQHRLYDLKLDSLLAGLIGWEGFVPPPGDPATKDYIRDGQTRKRTRLRNVYMVSEEECKPNELHYLRALEAVGSDPDNAWAIGDSRAKDLEPAARLGIKTIWARYGATFDNKNMATLLRITHWSPSRIHATYEKNDFCPDAVLDSFEELQTIFPERNPMLF